MTTHVLMINPQLSFTVSLKQALERTGVFDVHPFTTVDAALDYLRDHPQDVALIDFRLPGIAGEALVREIRAIQPDVALIVSPQQSDDSMRSLQLQDTLNTPFSAREIIPRLNRAVLARTTIVVDEEETPQSGEQATRLLPQEDEPPRSTRLHMPGTTRRLIDPDVEENRSDLPDELPPRFFEQRTTRILEDPDDGGVVSNATPAPPSEVPEFSSLDNVVRETGALAQPDEEQKPPRDPFHELVQSMRSENPHKPLPERSQRLIDFTLPTDPERTRAITPKPAEGDTVFRRLADEEPPMPTLEESGTVGDLMTGIGDSGFRNVLAILRGEDPPPTEPEVPTLSPQEVEDAITALLNAEIDRTAAGQVNPADDPYRSFDSVEDEDEEEDTPAKVILETTLDESTPLESFSLGDLIQSIERKLPEYRPNVQPLPSWRLEIEPLVREPDFLPEEIPAEASSEFADQITQPHAPAIPVGDYETEQMDAPERTQPIGLPELPAAMWEVEPEAAPEDTPTLLVDDVEAAQNVTAEVELISTESEEVTPELDAEWLDAEWPDAEPSQPIAVEEFELEPEMFEQAFERYAPFEETENEEFTPTLGIAPVEDPRIAQLALGLTQLSLETTAEATLLTKYGEIIAYAGQLTREDLNELRAAIDDDWDTTVEEARVRFITLHDSGREFMLYSRQTEDELTLSMIFAGTTALRDIRRQGKRLVEALRAVPESPEEVLSPPPAPILAPPPPASAPEPRTPERTALPTPAVEVPAVAPSAIVVTPPDVGVLIPYACVWILRDVNGRLEEATGQAIMAGLRTQLHERGWRVRIVHAENEFVYLLAEVPESLPVKDMIRDLKRRSAEIARALEPQIRPDSLWADAYLLVTPGRELELDEIQQFISFERM